MSSWKMSVPVILLSLLLAASPAKGVISFPPEEADWEANKAQREDLRPLQVYNLANQPTVDGRIDPAEWVGATQYEVIGPDPDPQGSGQDILLGTLYAGLYDGYLYVANDWTINTNSDPDFGGGNAWRFGTATGPGAGGSGSGMWYEVYVDEAGAEDGVYAREAPSDDLPGAKWQVGGDFGIDAGSFFDGNNWQYELFLGEGSGPGELPPCWHWEWRQLDPAPWDGSWIAVYDGSVHNNTPEPASLIVWSLLAALGIVVGWWRRKRAG